MDPLATAADLSTATGLPVDDPELLLALKRASGRFRLAAGHSVSYVAAEEIYLSGDGTAELLLPGAPVDTIKVEIVSGLLPVELIIGSGYQVKRQSGRLHKAGGWPAGLDNIRVTYSHGYKTLPEGVEDAVLEHATTLALSYAHVQQESTGNNSLSFGAAAVIGVTQKWVDAVEACKLRGRA